MCKREGVSLGLMSYSNSLRKGKSKRDKAESDMRETVNGAREVTKCPLLDEDSTLSTSSLKWLAYWFARFILAVEHGIG